MSEPWLQLAFAFGGGLGAVARHGVALAIVHRWPLATLLVNVLGSATLGVALVGLEDASPVLRHAAIGFTGGFTTFSSFAYQTLDLHRRATLAHAAGNILASLLACVAAFALGGALAARF